MPGGRPGRSLLEQALAATRSSRRFELRAELGAWPELVRDIVAIANSGGGVVLAGVGTSEATELTDQLAHHLGDQHVDITITPGSKDGRRVVAIEIGGHPGPPLVFEQAGGDVFARGTIYVRHGARSEPAIARDLARIATREEARIRRELLANLRRVSTAPSGSQVLIVPPTSAPTTSLERVRLVDDPNAPAVARADFDVTHPNRQKEIVSAVNARLGGPVVNAHDLLSVRRVHDVDANEAWFHHPRFGSPQYSDAFLDWLVASYAQNPRFFEEAKEEYHRRLAARRAAG